MAAERGNVEEVPQNVDKSMDGLLLLIGYLGMVVQADCVQKFSNFGDAITPFFRIRQIFH